MSSNSPGVANRKEEYERERNVALRAAARGIHIFLSRFKSEWPYRRAIAPSLSCVRKGSHTAGTRVENGLYRGECVRSVLVPIGSGHQRFSGPSNKSAGVSGSLRVGLAELPRRVLFETRFFFFSPIITRT